jgi:HlyD family type I secretion membrane fusion protein
MEWNARNMRFLRHGLLIPIAVAAALLMTWMAFAPLAGAVVAPAQIMVDQVERQIVRSPVDREVMEMRVSGAGEVIAPREPLLVDVPSQARLVVEARIRPEDINRVQINASAQVRLTSFDARTTPLLSGNVTFVSGDRITSADGRESYFTATVEVDAANLKGHPEIRLQPGMPAELYVATGTRNLFQYLLRPITSFALRTMREP